MNCAVSRKETILCLGEIEAKREPPPAIGCKTVEALNEAYGQFEKEKTN